MLKKKDKSKKVLPNFPGRPMSQSTEPAVGLEAFESKNAQQINQARLEHLAALNLDLTKKRVLDFGSGTGELSRFFLNRQCEVVCMDARQENIQVLKTRLPNIKAYVHDIESNTPLNAGFFDIIFCYGLFYHLENPIRALCQLAECCKEILLLETIVTDHSLPLTCLVQESLSSNQALKGLGNRPTPSYIISGLNHAGFPFVYRTASNPEHPDFQFQWKNDLTHTRDGHNLRCIFIASKQPLNNQNLILVSETGK